MGARPLPEDPLTARVTNPLLELLAQGQSAWYDYIRRDLIVSGELDRLIAEDGLRGMTSNPAIWEKAISGSADYAAAITELRDAGSRSAVEIYEALATVDLRAAADAFRPVYERTARGDGYVSIEVAPRLAHDTAGTIGEARRLWETIGRENLMIKVPATEAGIPAIRALIARGINVNVTLLFAVPVYEQVADAYVSGLEEYVAGGGDPARVSSVASFFVSRIDTVVDAQLEQIATGAEAPERRALARELQGKAAIANAKLAYRLYKEIVAGRRWQALADLGARPQRLLWASTSTKNPQYPELLYVEGLIGPETIDTMPPTTFDAFRAHGRALSSLESGLDQARAALAALAELGIALDEVTSKLTEDGVDLFATAFEALLGAIADAGAEAEVARTIEEWGRGGKTARLWARDAALWTGGDEAQWLGWLEIAQVQLGDLERFAALARDARESGLRHALLLGMGGSSLWPEMLRLTFQSRAGHPQLAVLDSTDPAQIAAVERELDLASTLLIVSSKSGTTLEPMLLYSYFFERVIEAVGAREAPRRFMAITDPGSSLERVAQDAGFRGVARGVTSIGGRYSALSDFGMVPAALMGLDVGELLERAARMAQRCAAAVPAAENPGVVLGASIAVRALRGRDKLTLVLSPAIRAFGAWLEQLVAESTGKQGVGVIPIDGEPLAAPGAYGGDRLFVHLRLAADDDPEQERALGAIERAGHPVVRIELADLHDLGAEAFRWELATAVAGSIMGIDPFDQPDVEASKVKTAELAAAYERTGELPARKPLATDGGLALYADARNAAELREGAGGATSFDALLGAHLARIGPGDYVALLAYVAMTPAHEDALCALRATIRDRTRAATSVGFGPRFLHSTGQAFKGGPDSGVFLQLTCDDLVDLVVPGRRATFGVVKAAQAHGDLEVLAARRRRALRIHLGADVAAGLEALRGLVERVLR